MKTLITRAPAILKRYFEPKATPKLVFLTHHKCASTWLTHVGRQLCAMNGFTHCATDLGSMRPFSGKDVSFILNAQYGNICEAIIPNSNYFHIIRNPLSVVLSAYHSHLSTHSLTGWESLVRQREILRKVDPEIGIFLTLSFVESSYFYPQTNGPLYDMSSWNYDDERIVTLRMEDITSNPKMFLETLSSTHLFKGAALPDANDFTFKKISGRDPGDVDSSSHYRSGSADEWRTALPESVITYVRSHHRHVLERFYPEALE
jgi:hypothetical protein